jgi:hypothetical protein
MNRDGCGLNARRFSKIGAAALVFPSLLFLSSCSKVGGKEASGPVHGHVHHPPHGGTPIVLGEEVYHIELVRDAANGTLDAFVLDDEMEEFIRIEQPTIECIVTTGTDRRTILFNAIADRATGETVGNTSFFEAKDDWVKSTSEFDGVLKNVQVKGATFTDVSFNFPKGNDRD